MATPVGFEGANDLLRAPPNTDCRDLEIYRNNDGITSCWRLTEKEIEEVVKTGVIWIHAVGVTHPPIFISGHALVLIGDRGAKAEKIIPIATKGGDL